MIRSVIKKYGVYFLFLFILLLFFGPYLKNTSYLGVRDLGHFSFNDAVARESYAHGEFPLWNPYYCGGNVMIAKPQSNYISPFFILHLFLPLMPAIKVNILLHLFMGLVGMYLLGRYFKWSFIGNITASFIFVINGVVWLKIQEGHYVWIGICWLPFIILFSLKSKEDIKYSLLAGLFLALAFLDGHAYSVLYTFLLIVVLFIVDIAKSKSLRPILPLIGIGISFLLISAVKLIPLISFISDNPKMTTLVGGYTFYHLILVLVSSNTIPGLPLMWHEFGAYMGVVPFILFLAGLLLFWRKLADFTISLIFFILLVMGSNSPINLSKFLHSLPFFSSIYSPYCLV